MIMIRTKPFKAAMLSGIAGCLAVGSAQADGLYVNPKSSTLEIAATLQGEDKAIAEAFGKVPSGTWFTQGTPDEVKAKATALFDGAAAEGKTALAVVYNIPFRDCALYSAGGATNTAEYIEWIEAFAAGVGDRKAIIALEPDGLGVIPFHKNINGDPEPCQPTDGEGAKAAEERYEQLSKAVDILKALPNTKVYLDGTGSSWLGAGDAANRLIQANVAKADGYFLNVSNYENDERVTTYAGWVSDCIALITEKNFEAKNCPSQYYPATFGDTATWVETTKAYDKAFADTGLTRDPAKQKHAIIDTSRNGLGSWAAPEGKYKDAEVWCNPPDRGLGRLPTLDTGNPYVDGFHWVKIPGESDGQCYRGTGGPIDPERQMKAPAAGQWFVEQARELVKFANPPFTIE